MDSRGLRLLWCCGCTAPPRPHILRTGLQRARTLRSQFASELASIGFLPSAQAATNSVAPCNANSKQLRLVRAALCAGLYANVVHVVKPKQRYQA